MAITRIIHSSSNAWDNYGNHFNKLGKSLSSIALILLPEKAAPLKGPVAFCKYGSLANIITRAPTLPAGFSSVAANFFSGDTEGFTLAVSSILIQTVDLLDSGLSTMKIFFEHPLLNYGLPLGLGLTVSSGLVKGVKTFQARNFYKEFQRVAQDQNEEQIKQFLKIKLGITKEEIRKLEEKCTVSEEEKQAWLKEEVQKLKALKKAALKRRSTPEVAKALEKLLELAERDAPLSDIERTEVFRLLGDIESALGRNLTSKEASLFASACTLAGILLFFTPVTPLAPLTLLALSRAIKIGLQLYKEGWQNKGIDLQFHGQVEQLRGSFEN